jgi:hypothetical protein
MAVSPAGRWCVLTAAILAPLAACGDDTTPVDGGTDAPPPATAAARGALDVGAEAVAIATGDFDGDGRADVAAACPRAGVVVVLGREGGAFAPTRTLAGVYPNGIVAADLDGDGKLDLAVSSGGGSAILRGNGDGTFQPPESLGVGATTIAAGDVDGDGKLDLALGHANGRVSLLRGHGDGTFQPAVDHEAIPDTQLPSINTLIAADFDGDGLTDVLAAGKLRRVTLFGQRDGTLRAGPVSTADIGVGKYLAFAAADVDGDGKADLVQADKDVDERRVSVLLGSGRWSWSEELGFLRAPSALWAGDLDGDGKADLAVAFAHTVQVVHGHGDGTFHGEDYFGVPGTPQALAAADLDGDGKVDLIAASPGRSDLAVIFGKGGGTFRGERSFVVGKYPRRVLAGDFNGDGWVDVLVTSDYDNDRYEVLLGDARGGMRTVSHGPIGSASADLIAADLDGDGKLDVVSGSGAVLLGNGDGTFRDVSVRRGFPAPLGVAPWSANTGVSLAASDLDGDGRLDVAMVTSGARGVVLRFGKGDGTFQQDRTLLLRAPTTALAAADLDGDGKPDLAVSSGRGLLLLFGRGDGTFEPALDSGQVNKPGRLVATDVDGDGRIDLVVEDADRGGTSVLRNAGARRFVRSATLAATGKIAVADLDGDGIVDLVLGGRPIAGEPREAISPIAFFLGKGDGTFQAARSFGVSGEDFALADVDRDGRPELLFVEKRGTFLRVAGNGKR